jgi:hypothetical protein
LRNFPPLATAHGNPGWQGKFPEPLLTRLNPLASRYYFPEETIMGQAGCFCAGATLLMDVGGRDPRNRREKAARELVWTSQPTFQGWTCSECEWNYPLPTLLSEAEARTAYDRLAASKFRDHQCAQHLARLGPADHDSFTVRIRKLVQQGFKPKDAVDLFLQEVALEYRGQPKTLEQAKTEAEDFLRRVKAGLI